MDILVGYGSVDIGVLVWQCLGRSEGRAFWIFSGYFLDILFLTH